MQVILLKDVDRVGKMGEIVDVKDGYGLNFLLPRKLAKRVTRMSIKFLEDEKKKVGLKQKRAKTNAEKYKEKLEGASCTIPVAAGDDEKIRHLHRTSEVRYLPLRHHGESLACAEKVEDNQPCAESVRRGQRCQQGDETRPKHSPLTSPPPFEGHQQTADYP